jgi:hypothetical protein
VKIDRHFDTSYFGAFDNKKMRQAAIEYRGGLTMEGMGGDDNDRSNIVMATAMAMCPN